MNVTVVVVPAFTDTVAAPVERLLLTSNAALGKVLTPASTSPPGMVSVTATEPVGTRIAALQVPNGAAPAATVTPVDWGGIAEGTVKVKFVPAATPLPATLQTCRKPLLQAAAEITLVSSVTAAFSAKTLPVSTFAPVFKVTLADAKIFPRNWVPVPRVAEVPIWKNTLQGEPLLITTTDELLAVVSVDPIWKMKTALGLP
jgi:hypothetical protein